MKFPEDNNWANTNCSFIQHNTALFLPPYYVTHITQLQKVIPFFRKFGSFNQFQILKYLYYVVSYIGKYQVDIKYDTIAATFFSTMTIYVLKEEF